MKRIISGILTCLMLTALLCGCNARNHQNESQTGEDAAQAVTTRLGALTGPTAIAMAGIYEEIQSAADEAAYSLQLFGSADELVPQLLQHEIDIASVPINLASVLYNKTEGAFVFLAADVLGVLNIVSYQSEGIASVADLRGKTLYATGQGNVPEVYLNYLLAQNGLDPEKDVQIEWKSEPGEVVALLKAQGAGIALLPQPYASAACMQMGEECRIAIRLTEAWEESGAESPCITAGVIVRHAFLEAHPEAVEAFLQRLEKSVTGVNADPAAAAAVCETMGFAKAAVLKKAIPECNLVCLRGSAMREAVSACLALQYEFSPSSIGGKMPGEDFYYEP